MGTPISGTVSTRLQRTHTQGRRSGRRWPDRQGVRVESRSESPDASRPLQVGPLPGAARATNLRAERRRKQDTAHRDTDLRGQGAPAGGGDGAGGRVRAGPSGLLARVPARSISARSAEAASRGAHVDGRGMASGSGHQELLRIPGSRPAPKHSRPEGARWCIATHDRQMAVCWSPGRLTTELPGRAHSARRRCLIASGDHLSTRGHGPLVREGREGAASRPRLHAPFRGRSGSGFQQ